MSYDLVTASPLFAIILTLQKYMIGTNRNSYSKVKRVLCYQIVLTIGTILVLAVGIACISIASTHPISVSLLCFGILSIILANNLAVFTLFFFLAIKHLIVPKK
ncbi:hypothetical protein C10C_0144 [Chlamydia serpentis]|uniref:Uncharacterized protein n=1 Tax=Chlamydia serpentis TaxID=1967782 RepID=A0A2R8FAJ5_9CHLA|nr:hypothetical protein [Chlamydia serpentis]SPN73326.1 hypothetical protein C10C_0144 [Chlamydia serpentis]